MHSCTGWQPIRSVQHLPQQQPCRGLGQRRQQLQLDLQQRHDIRLCTIPCAADRLLLPSRSSECHLAAECIGIWGYTNTANTVFGQQRADHMGAGQLDWYTFHATTNRHARVGGIAHCCLKQCSTFSIVQPVCCSSVSMQKTQPFVRRCFHVAYSACVQTDYLCLAQSLAAKAQFCHLLRPVDVCALMPQCLPAQPTLA